MEINEISDTMVLIGEVCEPKIYRNEGSFGESKSGFHIKRPSVGYVEKEFWEFIDIFQNINLSGSDELNKMFDDGQKVTSEDLVRGTDVDVWINLQRTSGCFGNIVEEFNSLVAVSMDGTMNFERNVCILGERNWELLEQNI